MDESDNYMYAGKNTGVLVVDSTSFARVGKCMSEQRPVDLQFE